MLEVLPVPGLGYDGEGFGVVWCTDGAQAEIDLLKNLHVCGRTRDTELGY